MECKSVSSITDFPSSSGDESEEVAMMADAPTVDSVAKHFNHLEIEGNTVQVTYSDCVICGKPTEQILEEAVNDYLDKTVAVGETLAETQARRRAFLDGMTAGTFRLMPGGVSRAAACVANHYTISYSFHRDLTGTLPGKGIKTNFSTNSEVII